MAQSHASSYAIVGGKYEMGLLSIYKLVWSIKNGCVEYLQIAQNRARIYQIIDGKYEMDLSSVYELLYL